MPLPRVQRPLSLTLVACVFFGVCLFFLLWVEVRVADCLSKWNELYFGPVVNWDAFHLLLKSSKPFVGCGLCDAFVVVSLLQLSGVDVCVEVAV